MHEFWRYLWDSVLVYFKVGVYNGCFPRFWFQTNYLTAFKVFQKGNMAPRKKKAETTTQTGSSSKKSRNEFSDKTWTSDLALVVEDKKLYVSRSVLALVSPVFTRMFESDFKEKNQEEITLNEKKYDDVLQLLRCVYPNILEPISLKNVFTILPLADEYQVERLKVGCEKVLLSAASTAHTSAVTLCQFISLACLYNLIGLEKKCVVLASQLNQEQLKSGEKKHPIPLSAKCKIQEEKIELLEDERTYLQDEKIDLEGSIAHIEEEKVGLQDEMKKILKATASRIDFYKGGCDVPEGIIELAINNVRNLSDSFTLNSPMVRLRGVHWYLVVYLSTDRKQLAFQLVLYEKPTSDYEVQGRLMYVSKTNDETYLAEMAESFPKMSPPGQLQAFNMALRMAFVEKPGNILGETLHVKAHILVKKMN